MIELCCEYLSVRCIWLYGLIMSRTPFQSESTLYSCLNVKELLARSRREIWRLCDCNWTRTRNHLVYKRTLNHLAKLAKWLSCVLSTYLYGAFEYLSVQMHRTDMYSQHSSIIWLVWLNGWVFVYELSDCGFESSSSHIVFRFRACFEQEVPWHSGNHRVWIHSETRTWHDKNIQSYSSIFSTLLEEKWPVRLQSRWRSTHEKDIRICNAF